MERIRRIVLASIVLVLAAAAIATDAAAESRPGWPIATETQRLMICLRNHGSCDQGCDQLIDIDNNVADCRKRCEARYSRCKKWATTQAMIVLPTGGISQLKSTCAKVGGAFDDGGGLLAICTKADCDGIGGECGVVCASQAFCTGHTPAPLTGNQTLLSILQNGDKVFRQRDQTPAGSLVESDDPSPSAPGPILY